MGTAGSKGSRIIIAAVWVSLLLLLSALAIAHDAAVLSSTGVAVGVQSGEAKALVGRWSGKILGRKIGSMANVHIDLAAVGMPSGSTAYFLRTVRGFDNLACRGYLKLVEATGTRFVFDETLTERGRGHDGGCPIAGTLVLTMSADGVAAGEWVTANVQSTVLQSGDLVKQ